MAKKGYESEKTGRKVDELLDKIDNLNVPEWALQESKPSYTAQEVHALPENTSIPKKTSDLVNDRGFITQESDPTVPSWAKQPSKPTYTAEEVGALSEDTPIFSGDYNDLRNKPTIPTVPTDVSAFNNDAGYLTDEDMGDYATKQELNTKQDTINDLGTIRSGASAGATAYQKPQTGIPESDLSQGVKDKLNEKEVFVAIRGTTTYEEIVSAATAGKNVICKDSNDKIYYLIGIPSNGGTVYFTAILQGQARLVQCTSSSVWSGWDTSLEVQSNKKTTITGNESSNSYYPTTKAVADYVAEKDKLVEVEYGVTTVAEIDAILANGKIPYINIINSDVNYTALLNAITSVRFVFSSINREQTFSVELTKASDTWSIYGVISLERAGNRKSTITGFEANNAVYPSTKAVADYVHQETAKWGVVSQKITWTANEYSLSNQVYGMIPIANIDLFKMGGAEFNDSDTDLSVTDMYGRTYTHKKGCFKLNGLGDISYQEMLTIYTEARMSQPFMTSTGEAYPRYLESTKARTNMWNLPGNWNTGASLYGLGSYNSDCNLTTIGLGFFRNNNATEFYPRACRQMLYACPRVKYVYPVLNCQYITGTGAAVNTFYLAFSAEKLQEIRLKALKISVSFGSCPELSVASVVYMINNEASTSATIITLHPTAYARAIADSDVQAALQAHTNVSLASAT